MSRSDCENQKALPVSRFEATFAGMIRQHIALCLAFLLFSAPSAAELVMDDFENSQPVYDWLGDDCIVDFHFANPFPTAINNSAGVLRYQDVGGQYANVRLQLQETIDLTQGPAFDVLVYVPSGSIDGDQPYQVSLKLQDGSLPEPWLTQTEIIKDIELDRWQMLRFDFSKDPFVNLDAGSSHPMLRGDFDRILLQVNGENNTSQVTAYFDDFTQHHSTIDSIPTYDRLVWSDEFETEGPIDNEKWFHQTKLPSGGSWYNGEVQHYTNRRANAEVRNGVLHVTARKERFTDQGQTKDYTSARLNSKFAFAYGRVEVRARLPRGIGTWPAIWMLGRNIAEDGAYWQQQGYGRIGWPDCGEIDIMEHWGDNQNFVQSAIHTRSSFGNTINKGGLSLPTASDLFHVYGVTWTEDRLVFSVDGVTIYTYAPDTTDLEQWPFFEPQYLLLNLAVEPFIDPAIEEATMEVDYVRVYQEAVPTQVTQIVEPSAHKIYPNPVTDDLAIEVGRNQHGSAIVKTFTLDGQLLDSTKCAIDDGRIVVSSLTDQFPGLYFVRYTIDGQIYEHQVLKQ